MIIVLFTHVVCKVFNSKTDPVKLRLLNYSLCHHLHPASCFLSDPPDVESDDDLFHSHSWTMNSSFISKAAFV